MASADGGGPETRAKLREAAAAPFANPSAALFTCLITGRKEQRTRAAAQERGDQVDVTVNAWGEAN